VRNLRQKKCPETRPSTHSMAEARKVRAEISGEEKGEQVGGADEKGFSASGSIQ